MDIIGLGLIVAVFGWTASTHLRAAQRSAGSARAFWRVIAAQNVAVAALLVLTVSNPDLGPSGPPAASFVALPTLLTAVAFALSTVLTAVAFAVLVFARTPLASRSRLLDLVILLVGGGALADALMRHLLESRHADLSMLLSSLTTPFAVLQLVALAWMLSLPGRRPRSLVLVMVGVALMSVQASTLVIWPTLNADHPLLGRLSTGLAMVAFVCWAKAARHSSAPEVTERAEQAPEAFGQSRLLLFATALVMLPLTMIVSSILGEIHLAPVVFCSTVLAGLVVLRFRSMFRSVEQSKGELAQQEHLFRSVVESVHDLILMTERDGTIVYRSPAAIRVFGESDAYGLGAQLHPEDFVKLAGLLADAGAAPGVSFRADVRFNLEQDDWQSFDLSVSDLSTLLGHEAILWSLHDVSDRTRLEGELRHQALHDGLTGLPNRVLAADRIGTAASRARRAGTDLCVLFVDLDNFKHINDTLGHASGDELLAVIATRLQETVRETDTVARLGGDEFALIVENMATQQEAAAFAERARAAVRAPVQLTAGRVSVTASVGIAYGSPDHAGDLLRHADVAMYEAKAAGKDFVVLFADGMANAGTNRLHLEMDLIDAMEAGDQLVVHYQPIVGLADEKVVGAEALVRWQHPTLGLLPPMQFVPIAEEIGLIGEIGRHVLVTACCHAAALQGEQPGYTMSVNVSARQLESGTLVEEVEEALLESGLDPTLLILELTESTVVRNIPEATRQLAEIRAMGTRIAIDDFGTGFSSVSALRDLPIDILKIDRSFVAGMHESVEGTKLVHALIEMGRSLNLWTIAEGVEEAGERDALLAEQCDAAQGYLFGRPVAEATPTPVRDLAAS
jgi:diguanylate cyclase (GGDEF)-like protein/PAS domain S-box-containing protein